MSIRAICFDADGVVVSPQMQFSKYLAEEHAITPAMTGGFFGGVFNDCLVGQADLYDVLPPYLDAWGWKGSVGAFIESWMEKEHVVDGRLIDEIQRLRKVAVLCCLATSQEQHRAAYMRTRMGFQDAFDYLFFSCDAGCQKPDHAFYRHIENALGLEVETILFWDDREKNVRAAREIGWQAELYNGFGGFIKTMRLYNTISRRG